MKPSKAGLILAAGSMFLGLGLAYYGARDAEWAKVVEVNSQIREITHADSLLDLEILRIRSAVVDHYDDVTRASIQLMETLQRLQSTIKALDQQESIDPALVRLEQHIFKKKDLVETIKSQNSVLRNSESYLPALLDEYLVEQQSRDTLLSVHSLLLRTIVLTDRDAGQKLRAQLQSLSPFNDYRDGLEDIRTRVVMHGVKALDTRQTIQPLLREYLNIPVHADIADLNAVFSKEQAAREITRERFRSILYGSAFGFFLLSIFILLHLARLNSKIRSFVPFEMLSLLGKKSLLNIEYGTGIQRSMTVMFVDLRDFTRTSEGRQPAENFAFVNEYLAAITPSIELHQGFVSQFTGDGVMALFPGEPQHALAAAIDVVQAQAELNRRRQARGDETLELGIGINTSELMLGTIGNAKRMECTVLGSGVNIAARVEGLTRSYGCEVLLTESTYRGLSSDANFQLRLIDRVRPKGLQEPVLLYELLDVDPPESRSDKIVNQANFQKARELYSQKKFQDAQRLFALCGPHDSVSRLYRERCAERLANPPEADWDAVADFSVK